MRSSRRLDSRTKAVKAMKADPDIDVSRSDYHGTTSSLNLTGGQSVTKKGKVCKVFIGMMNEAGHLDGARVWKHMT